MKKKLLFVLNALNCGGAEKSLISLLETIDFEKYDVDLFLFKHEGMFLNKIPKEVNLLEEPKEYKFFDMPISTAIIENLKNRSIKNAILRVRAGVVFRSEVNRTRCNQRIWKYISKSLKDINKDYDIAIGYLEMSPIYFIIDKVKAKKKIGWIHTNYSNSGMDKRVDEPLFRKLDHIITVSDECKRSLDAEFPNLSGKSRVINNIVSPKIIERLSNFGIKYNFIGNKQAIKIVTVARLCQVKGIDIAIEACRKLIDEGYNIEWLVLGTGTEQEILEYQNLIKYYNLQNEFNLLGLQENPYPFIKIADIYVQPSRNEGKSIAIDEAKILKKPIVVTNFSTAKDQISNEKNGLIVNMDGHSLAKGIKRLIDFQDLRKELSFNLSREDLGNESEIDKLYEVL